MAHENLKSPPLTLARVNWPQAVAALCERDQTLADLLASWGRPPFWEHPPGFAGLVLAILAQLVSLESAHGTWRKLRAALPALMPADFLACDEVVLRRAGCSRAKVCYIRAAAQRMVDGSFDLAALQELPNDAARAQLVQLDGVGPWTADTYLLFSLRRADAWPSGDLALERMLADPQTTGRAAARGQADRVAERWRPQRAVAARILWHAYLHEHGRFDAVNRSWAEVAEQTI